MILFFFVHLKLTDLINFTKHCFKGAWSIPVEVLVGPSDGISYRPEQASKVSEVMYKRRAMFYIGNFDMRRCTYILTLLIE